MIFLKTFSNYFYSFFYACFHAIIINFHVPYGILKTLVTWILHENQDVNFCFCKSLNLFELFFPMILSFYMSDQWHYYSCLKIINVATFIISSLQRGIKIHIYKCQWIFMELFMVPFADRNSFLNFVQFLYVRLHP